MAKSRTAVLLVAVALFLVLPRSARAAALRVVGEPGVENKFPDALIFTIEAESDVPIQDVRLRYTFVPDGTSSTARAEFEPGTRVKASFSLRSGSSRLYIPPGKGLRYSWELRDASGAEIRTDERDTTFADTRFQWQQVTDGVVNLYYYRGTQRDAEVMAQVANETITKAAQLMGTTLDFPIKMWAYASQRDFQQAIARESVTSDPGVLGQAHDPDIFIMVVDRLSSPTALDTARHELTHLITANALRGGAYKDLYPSWLNEGTSVLFQASPNDVGYIDALEKAIRDDTVVPIQSLTAGNRARDVGLFYGQSYAIVKFLVTRWGPEKFAQMMTVFKQNGSEDQTFQQVYGLDRTALYREWRQSVGLPADPPAASGSGSSSPDAAAAPAKSGGDSSTVVLAVVGGVLLVLLAGAAIGGGLILARRAAGRPAE